MIETMKYFSHIWEITLTVGYSIKMNLRSTQIIISVISYGFLHSIIFCGWGFVRELDTGYSTKAFYEEKSMFLVAGLALTLYISVTELPLNF